MGVWEFINSTTESVKRNAPDPTPVKEACRTSYGYGSAAFWKIDNAVRVKGLQKLNEHMPDEKGRAQITLFASKFFQNAAPYAFKEAYELVPGGRIVSSVSEIISKTVDDVKSENPNNQEEEAVKEVISISASKTPSSRNVLDRVEKHSKDVQFGYQKETSAGSTPNQTPEDVMRIFMMKEFIGTRFLDDLIIPQKRHGREPKQT